MANKWQSFPDLILVTLICWQNSSKILSSIALQAFCCRTMLELWVSNWRCRSVNSSCATGNFTTESSRYKWHNTKCSEFTEKLRYSQLNLPHKTTNRNKVIIDIILAPGQVPVVHWVCLFRVAYTCPLCAHHVSKGTWAVKLFTNKILQFLTGGAG